MPVSHKTSYALCNSKQNGTKRTGRRSSSTSEQQLLPLSLLRSLPLPLLPLLPLTTTTTATISTATTTTRVLLRLPLALVVVVVVVVVVLLLLLLLLRLPPLQPTNRPVFVNAHGLCRLPTGAICNQGVRGTSSVAQHRAILLVSSRSSELRI